LLTNVQVRPRVEAWWFVAIVGVAVAATAVFALVPNLRLAYAAPSLKVSLETACALTSALVGYLVVGRYRLTGRRDLALVAAGMFVLAFGSATLLLLPAWFRPYGDGGRVATWLPLAAQLVGAILLAVAAVGDERNRAVGRDVTAGVAAIVVIVVIAVIVNLPADNSRTLPIASSVRPQLDREPLVVTVQLGIAIFLAIAAIGFLLRARREQEAFGWWLALGAALGAIARINFALFPSLFSRWVYTGDVIRLLGYVAWLVGAITEISSYWQQRAELAVDEERRRLARELHDGLAQELAFIVTETRSWPDGERVGSIASSAERALSESRRAIAALASDGPEALDDVLSKTLEPIVDRYGCGIRIDVDAGTDLDGAMVEDLVRIAREATNNACRHGRARRILVIVSTSATGGSLVVRDDGVGFDCDRAEAGASYGLRSMRERAERVGGALAIKSSFGVGTDVRVTW
jgi:signal transduction histidine kinase